MDEHKSTHTQTKERNISIEMDSVEDKSKHFKFDTTIIIIIKTFTTFIK